jgi:hypothetical protein
VDHSIRVKSVKEVFTRGAFHIQARNLRGVAFEPIIEAARSAFKL